MVHSLTRKCDFNERLIYEKTTDGSDEKFKKLLKPKPDEIVIVAHMDRRHSPINPYTMEPQSGKPYDTVWKSVRHITSTGEHQLLYIHVRRIKYTDENGENHIVREWIDGIDNGRKFTNKYEEEMCLKAQMYGNYSAVGAMNGISWHTVNRISGTVLEKKDEEYRLEDELVNIAQDEKHNNSNGFITFSYNADTRNLIHMCEGKDAEAYQQVYQQMPKEDLDKIKTISGDGTTSLDSVVKSINNGRSSDNVVNRNYDSMHISKNVSKQVDEVRKHLRTKNKGTDKKFVDLLWEHRYNLRRYHEDLPDDNVKIVQSLLEKDLELCETWYILQEMSTLLHKAGTEGVVKEFECLLEQVGDMVECDKFPAVKKQFKFLNKYKNEIANTLITNINNGFVEAFNNLFEHIIGICYGLKNEKNIKVRAAWNLGYKKELLFRELKGRPYSTRNFASQLIDSQNLCESF